MSLPAYVRTQVSELVEDFHKGNDPLEVLTILFRGAMENYELSTAYYKEVSIFKLMKDAIKARYRWGYMKYMNGNEIKTYPEDPLSKISYDKYIGLEQVGYHWKAMTRRIQISMWMEDKYAAFDREKEERDRRQVELRDKIIAIKERVYGRRNFPESLRQIIFERDNYTCQVCGKPREVLIDEGQHLECDHIEEWEDGGQTTYNNGQTVCSGCNKGKHHSKRYFRAKAEISPALN